MKIAPQFIALTWKDQPITIEYCWVGSADSAAPIMVFLHEGLGSLAMWKDFPAELCAALGCRGLVYSRPGYGRSSPPAPDERWQPDFMHEQAYDVLPRLLSALDLQPEARPIWLFGHSDGGSIALLYAARYPAYVRGAILLAPHLFVEELTIRSIAKADQAYRTTDLPQKLARYHDAVDASFNCWAGIWLDPVFTSWNIEPEISSASCPILAIQGENDEYGSMNQIDTIARHLPQTKLVKLAECRHSPHRDQPQRVIEACCEFFARTAQLALTV